jgi:predicted metalloprotease
MSQAEREAKVQADVNGLAPLLDRFWTAELKRLYGMKFDPPAHLYFYRSTGWDPCGTSTSSKTDNAFFCPVEVDEKVEYDLNWLQGYLVDRPGGATTFLVLAHEWGHAVQDAWVEGSGGDVWDPAYTQELNADCLAGVFIARSVADGTIIEETGDANAIYSWLFAGGSVDGWLNPGDHGSPQQRQTAFADGYIRGTDYCRQSY